MNSSTPLIQNFITLADESAVVADIVQLSDDELAAIATGIGALPPPVDAVCRALLESWPHLGPSERSAGLLVLANALAAID
jgi:hypothetical protein